MTSSTTTTSATAPHTYAAVGTYTITVTATLQGWRNRHRQHSRSSCRNDFEEDRATRARHIRSRIRHGRLAGGHGRHRDRAQHDAAGVLDVGAPRAGGRAVFRGQQYARAVASSNASTATRFHRISTCCSTSGSCASSTRIRSPAMIFSWWDPAAPSCASGQLRRRDSSSAGEGRRWRSAIVQQQQQQSQQTVRARRAVESR